VSRNSSNAPERGGAEAGASACISGMRSMYRYRSTQHHKLPCTRATILTSIRRVTAVDVLEVVEGGRVDGVTVWYHVRVDGREGYIHSSFLSPTPPATGGSSSNSSDTAPVSTPVPNSSAPAAGGFACSCSKTCSAMVSCDEAYFQLQQCGCSDRDGDSDGVPCEAICPGG
jgi:Bacterial SH3 domain